MKKIVIIGPSGSGKSTFARKLHNITNIPLFPLDNIWWNKDKTHISRDNFDKILDGLLNQNEWIIEGDYSRTYDIRMQHADTIFFLDYPLEVCLKGAEERVGKKREDIPWVEEEFDPEFKKWIIDWFSLTRPKALDLIRKYSQDKKVFVFYTRDEANAYLDKLTKEQ